MRIEIESAFWVAGRGLVVTGKATTQPPVGQVMEIIRPGRETWERECIGVESLALCCGQHGERHVGLIFRNIKKDDIQAGDTVVFSV